MELSMTIWILIIAVAVWSVPWKAWALWRSARRGEKIWFVVFLFINTIGILEIIYIFLISKGGKHGKK